MDKIEKLMVLLKRFIEKKWFGKIEISVESGQIVNLKVTENLKL